MSVRAYPFVGTPIKTKMAPQIEKKVAKKSPHRDKGPSGKMCRKAQNIDFSGGEANDYFCPPLRAPMHVIDYKRHTI